MHVVVCFLLRWELLPRILGSGKTALKKETLISTFPGTWDRKFAGCGKSEPLAGMNR